MSFKYDEGAPSIFYATPTTPDRTSYFASLKKSNLQLKGSYSYQGKKYECGKDDCMMMIDHGRTHTVYGVQYFWVMFMGRLADGRAVSLSMSDGMSSGYDGLDQSTEDFIAIDKKLYRLDVSRVESEDKTQYVSEKRVRTAPETPGHKRIFPQNDCDLNFEPVISGSP